MISLRLDTYLPKDVDVTLNTFMELKEIICPIEKGNEKIGCKSCEMHRLCYDLQSAIAYLTDEQKNGYPHTRKKTRS